MMILHQPPVVWLQLVIIVALVAFMIIVVALYRHVNRRVDQLQVPEPEPTTERIPQLPIPRQVERIKIIPASGRYI